MNFTEKYLPTSPKEVIGQAEALKKTQDFIENFKPGKALLLYGPVGCGKTSLVYALSSGFNKEVFEVNASDVRNKAQIEELVGAAVNQQSLLSFGKGKIILFDEIDGLSGQKDRGASSAITTLIKNSTYPIIMTANDPSGKKFSDLRKKSVVVECNPLDYTIIFEKLVEICKKESIIYDESVVRDLARRCGGDMRAALTDLQLVCVDGKIDDISILSERSQSEKIEQALFRLFKTKDPKLAIAAFDNVDVDIDTQFMWINYNLPKEYEGEDLYNALYSLSKANVFMGRIRRWQHWRFLVYVNTLMTAGVALAKKEKYKKSPRFEQSRKPLDIWLAKMKYQKKMDIAQKIADKTHTSKKRALNDTFPYVQAMVKNKNAEIIKELGLSSEEVEWLQR